jgi:hypothetical protein
MTVADFSGDGRNREIKTAIKPGKVNVHGQQVPSD